MCASTGTTLDPVVSRAMASTCSPEMPAEATALRVAAARARIWSACAWVAKSGSSRLRCSGYSSTAVPRRPRWLSTMETRTLSVPKSTPATMAMRDSWMNCSPLTFPGRSGENLRKRLPRRFHTSFPVCPLSRSYEDGTTPCAGRVTDPMRPEFSSTTMTRSDPALGLEGKGWSKGMPSRSTFW